MNLCKQNGFTLIEVLVFIIVTSLLMSTILLGTITTLRATPNVHNQWVAMQSARQCMEWLLGQRRLNGYSVLSCPSTPSGGGCTVPSGFNVTASVSCTTWKSDSAYKTITVTIGGLAPASLSVQIGDF